MPGGIAMRIILGSALLTGACCAASEGGGWRAGAGVADITPTGPVWMAGYASRSHAAEGTLHPLHVKALALEDGAGTRGLLLTSELLGFPPETAQRLSDLLCRAHTLPRSAVMLSCSHTHSGPVLPHALSDIYPLDGEAREAIEAYGTVLEARVMEAARQAFGTMEPVTLASGAGITRFAVNRRENIEAQIFENAFVKGPSDHTVPVIRVSRSDGSLLAVVFGYACHATVLDGYQWSGDYPGCAQTELEAAHPSATALFFAGCGADQNPMPRRTVERARQYGRELAAAVDRVLGEGMVPLEARLETQHREIELALAEVPGADRLAELAHSTTGYEQRCYTRMLADARAGHLFPQTLPYPVQLWRLGNQSLLALGGEVVVDYALSAKRMLGPDTFVMGYANGVVGYIPSERILHEGGYEGKVAQVVYGLPAAWSDDVEKRILVGIAETAREAGLEVKE